MKPLLLTACVVLATAIAEPQGFRIPDARSQWKLDRKGSE